MPESPTSDNPGPEGLVIIDEPDDAVPTLYCNSVSLDRSLSDVGITFYQGTTPKQAVRMPFITAKTLAVHLNGLILDFEGRMQLAIPTMNDVHEKFSGTPPPEAEEPVE